VKDKKPLPFWESHKILLSSRREIAVGLRGGGGGARVGPFSHHRQITSPEEAHI
jgi:hypothetical protein